MKPKLAPVKSMSTPQLKLEWKRLGRRALRLWKMSGGMDPEIDILFKRMDAADRALARAVRRQRSEASAR